MKYIEFKVRASRQGVEQVTALFMSKGITSVSINDPEDINDIMSQENAYKWDYVEDKLKDNLDREPSISAYFEDTPENREFVQQLKISVMMLKSRELEGLYGWDVDFGRLYAEDIIVDDEDWKDKWKEHFKPTHITDSLVVKPTWEEYEPAEGETVIQIDPGMAFGTGTHETTSLCMKLLEKYLGDSPQEKKVMDIGCGSGILSVAAALMGSGRVMGVEIDKDAVEVANENVKLNHVEDTVTVKQGNLTDGADFKADIIVANLMADLVVKLASGARSHLNKDGIYISSGILLEKKEQVAEAVKAAGFEIMEITEDGEWCAIAAKVKKGFFRRLFG